MERRRFSDTKRMTSGGIAKMRLEQTLASDFLECSSQQFQTMQKEILELLSRYMNIDSTQEIQLNLIQETKQGVHYVKTIQIKGL